MFKIKCNLEYNPIMSKVVIVIGGTGGIGFSLCEMLYKKSNVIYLVGRSKKSAKSSAKKIGKGVIPEVADVLDEKSLIKLFSSVIKKRKGIDMVVNLAGVFEPFGEFEKVKLKDHHKVIQVNLLGSFNVSHSILPIYKKQGYGKIILFSGGGIGGDTPLINASSYFTSKGAVSIFAEVLGKELEKENIQINAILPGQILTKSTRKTFKISNKRLGPVLGLVTKTLKETGGNSVEPALSLMDFLISDDSNHISGRTLSAKWDSIGSLKKDINDVKFKLRRIDGKIYKKIKIQA